MDWQYLVYYLAAVSVFGILLTVSDKHRAKHDRKRISEDNLIVVGLLGGAAAMYLVMLIIRHKTRHRKFMLGFPGIILLQVFLIFLLIRQEVITI